MGNSLRLRRALFHPAGVEIRGLIGRPYLGISLNNQLVESRDALKVILSWMQNQFGVYEILVGDHLHRHNLILAGAVDEMTAAAQAIAEAAAVEQRIREVALELDQHDLVFRSSLSFYSNGAFAVHVERFRELLTTMPMFGRLVEEATNTFLRRKHPQLLKSASARANSIAYQLEELAMFEMLADQGFRINVYPGRQLPTMLAIVEGRLPNVSPILETLTLVELQMITQHWKS